jgi:hypothetical protein
MYVCVCMYECMHVSRICMYVYMYMYIFMNVCIFQTELLDLKGCASSETAHLVWQLSYLRVCCCVTVDICSLVTI